MTTEQSKEKSNMLIELLTRQYFLYGQLRELAQRQSLVVDGNDPEMLLKILAARQRLIDQLMGVGRELAPIRAEWPKVAKSLTTEERRETQRLIDSVREILGEIISHDEDDYKVLNTQKKKVADEIRGTTAGQRMNQAYAQAAGPDQSRFVDTRSG